VLSFRWGFVELAGIDAIKGDAVIAVSPFFPLSGLAINIRGDPMNKDMLMQRP
jgi:hypothetical protein